MASKEFYESPRWRLLRYKILERDNFTCLACNRTKTDGVILHVDHIKPISCFPELALTPENLQVLCADCNLGKSNLFDTDHRASLDKFYNDKAVKERAENKERENEIERSILFGSDETEKARYLDKKCMRKWAEFSNQIKTELRRTEDSGDAKTHEMLTHEYLKAQRRVQDIFSYSDNNTLTLRCREFPPGLDHHGNPIQVSS